MKNQLYSLLILLALFTFGCKVENETSTTANRPTPAASGSPSPSPANVATTSQLTLPVLDALLADENFVKQLKEQLSVSDDQISSLKRVASEDVSRLRQANAEEESGETSDARSRASGQISSVIGDEKAKKLADMARDFWAKNGLDTEGTSGKQAANELAPKPNAIPTDTRIVVNTPAFRMDLFKEGKLVKSYKIGIGYPEFPLPQGLRKAQTIIFNPTWTPPDSPWVAKMKDITPGQKIEAGSDLNPLGPIKIPIGLPSLIHGGKAVSKLGNFASHGCVGLTTAQIKDFARMLASISGTQVTDKMVASYLADKTQTKVVKLAQVVPVELRYETIVVEDGKLHIYKDVYDQNTNTEENLRAVLDANGMNMDSLSSEDKAKIMDALNLMSAHPQKNVAPLPSPSPVESNANDRTSKKPKAKPSPTPSAKKQKEVVIDVAGLSGKGYPAPVDLDNGTGKPSVAMAPAKSR